MEAKPVEKDTLRDLKQLDERLQRAAQLLNSCVEIFDETYRQEYENQETCSWPYAIKDNVLVWPNYDEDFPASRYLSPSTAAMCGWAVSRLSIVSSEAGKRLQSAAASAAKKLASLPDNRLRSKTFTKEDDVFLHAQVLRLLASQARYQGLFNDVFGKVRETITNPERLHPFFLHYCVLAMEEVRGPALEISSKVQMIRELAKRLDVDPPKGDALTGLMDFLELASGLRDALESFATVVAIRLRRPEIGESLDRSATDTKKVIELLRTALTTGVNELSAVPLDQLRQIVQESLKHTKEVLKALPSSITRMPSDPENAGDQIETAINNILNEPWYGETFRSRLKEEVINQVSYASSSEESRLDVGALAYSLSAITHSDAFYLPPAIARKAVSIVIEHQHRGRWNDIQPISRKAVGFVHFPLNIEIANALLAVMLRNLDTGTVMSWAQIDEVMDWISDTVNKVGRYRGWCNEHDYDSQRIDLWVTAQVSQFLLDYSEIRSKLVVRAALERVGIVTVSPYSVGTTWKKLSPTDLEEPHDKQIKNKLKDAFVLAHERAQSPRSSSVLLYGPPGTSKTSIMEALANRLGWQFLQITPADFLSTGGENVEARATLLFEILRRGKNLVILFDEVDELLLDREAADRPTGIFRFMTTSMLPKLQSLKSRGAVIFGIATNYKERLDRAITRQGRVDHDWAVLPPDFTSRIVLIRTFKNLSDAGLTRAFAGDSPFFSYPELKKAVSAGLELEPRSVVPHPTSDPEAYRNRKGSDDEFRVLLNTQVTDAIVNLAKLETKEALKEQLEQLVSKGMFDEDTSDVIKEKINKLS
jgi:hypothetical protein